MLYNVIMKIKKLKFKNGLILKNNVFLAPMAGWTDVGFRSLCYKEGAGLCFTEMISAKALLYGNKKTFDMLAIEENEKPIAIQLFGHEPEVFARVVKMQELQKFDIIDINMGCPAPKIVKNGEGCHLMTDIELARNIIRSVVLNTDKVVSVKFRKGFSEDSVNAVKFAKMCEEEGVSFITIHGRTKTQGYSGRNDLDIIKDVVKNVQIPVIANGDILNEIDMKNVLEYTGASGVMIGRGAVGNPEIFAKCVGKNSKLSKKQQILYHFRILEKYHDEKFVLLTMKKHLVSYAKGITKNTDFVKKIMKTSNILEMKNLIEEYFD